MKNIYLFSEIDSSIRETLGKNACEMIDTEPNSLGFVLTQEACAEFYITREIEKDLRGRITAVLDGLCSDAGVKFGESATVSIFASTVVPMPGILEKINGVGLNESVLSTLPDEAAQKAWALHLQLMKAFACEMDVSSRHFTDLENEATGKYGVDEIEKLSVEALRELCAAFKNVYAAQGVCSLSTDPYEQFFMLLKTAFRSWDNPRACVYRGMKGITDSGLSIAVQLVDLKTGKYFKNRTTIAAADRNNKEKDASNKSEPQGEFKRIEIDGDLFEGYFINGKKNGRGKYIWANGDIFDGNWVDGKRTGKGRITWSNGDTYEGEWKDGKLCGRGKLIQYGKSPTGETYMKYSYDGEWLDSKEHGHGICVEGDFGWEKMDKVFEGEWVDGKRQGRFVWYYTNSKGGRYMDFYEDGNLIETCIPYDESIKTVEDARRAKALADGKGRSSAVARTTTTPAAAPSNLSADGLLSRYNSTFILDFVSENPAIFRADYDNENLNRAVNALKKGDGLHFLFYVKRSKSLSMLNICCMELYPILLKMYRIYTEDIYNNLVRRLVYKNNLADLSCEDAEYCLYLFDAFIPHGRDYEAMARCYYRLGDVKSAARWVAEGCPLYDEIMAFRNLQKAQNVWERGRYAFNEDSKSSFADMADDRLVIAEKCLSRAQKIGHSYRLGEIQEQASILRSELQPYLW